MVIFLFLRSASATFIPALAVPISLLGTCAVMYMLDFSINNMTLLALTLSVGFVVDDAIVMLENIVRHIEHGMRPFEAALKGAREIGFTIISITFSLIAVFIPVLLMGGIVGRVFREFAVTIAVAIMVSGFVSLTLTPMLCARVLKAHDPEQEAEYRAAHVRGDVRRLAARLRMGARPGAGPQGAHAAGDVRHARRHRRLYMVVPKGFFPQEDTGFLTGITEAATDTSFEAMTVRQQALADILKTDPAVDYINSTVGAGGPNPTANYGRLFIALKPRNERDGAAGGDGAPAAEGHRSSGHAGVFPEHPEPQYRRPAVEEPVSVHAAEQRHRTLYRLAPEMRDKIAKVPGLLDVTTDLYIKNPQMTVDIDREKAAVYGITVDQVRNQLYNAFGSRQVGTIYMPSNDYQIILEAQPQFRVDPSDLSKLYMKTANNQTIPLDAVAKLVPTVGPLQINHQGQQPAVTISFNLAPGFSLGYAVDQITAIEQASNLPATIATGFSGTAQVFQDSLRGQGVLILAAVFAAFVILGILYESFIHPITIISGLPSAGIGAILTLMLFNMDLSVIAMIGIVMLVGIVKKNAIMMVDFALERRRVGPKRRARHPRGRAAAVPPDHDDDLRRDLRDAADRARHRRRRRIAPAARRRGGRRPLRLAAADAVHHAGDLHLSRPHRPPPEAPARAAVRRDRKRAAARGRGGVTAPPRRSTFSSPTVDGQSRRFAATACSIKDWVQIPAHADRGSRSRSSTRICTTLGNRSRWLPARRQCSRCSTSTASNS